MLNKNDPLIGAVQEVMKKNQAEREAARLVNEKFGVSDRKALPHEKQGDWDAAYKAVLNEGLHPNQQKLDVHEPEKDKLTKHDFKMLRAKKKPMEEDVTSPSSMGIKKPDYAPAGSTPDYAKPKEQTVNRAAKTSLPAGTMKEEKADKFAKVMREFKKRKLHSGSKKGPVVTDPQQAKAIAASEAGISKKKVNEGFNIRHGLSENASAEKQAVAVLNERSPGTARKWMEKNPTQGETLGNVATSLIPGIDAIKKAKEGDYKGAVKSGAFDLGATLAGGAIAKGLGSAYKYGKSLLKGKNAVSAVPKIAQSSGQGNRLAAPKRPETGPWGANKPPEVKASTSKLSSPAGTFAANLQKSRQAAQNARVGGSTVAATQAASRTKMAQTAQAGRAGTSTVAATQQAARTAVRQRLAQTAKDARVGLGRVASNAANDKVLKGAVATGAAIGAAKVAQQSNAPAPATATTTKDQSKVPPTNVTTTAPKDQSRVPTNNNNAARLQAIRRPVAAPEKQASTIPKPNLRPAAPAPAAAKPAAPAPAKKAVAPTAPAQPVRKAAPQDSSTPAQRAQFNRRVDRGNAAPGTQYKGLGVKSGTNIQQKAAPQVKRPVGTGREK